MKPTLCSLRLWHSFRDNVTAMMQVNLFQGQDPLPVSSPHAISPQNPNLKTLENHLADAADFVAYNHKPQVSNNNESSFPKDIFTITQGKKILNKQ